MTLIFVPHSDEAEKGSLLDRVDVLMEAAQRYKSQVLDSSTRPEEVSTDKRLTIPRDLKLVYNWEEIARVLREIRELPEASNVDKMRKSELLSRLSEIYEVLRAAKMSKLEAVRLALINEANQLRGGSTNQVT